MKEIVFNSDFCSIVDTMGDYRKDYHPIKRQEIINSTKFWNRLSGSISLGNEILPVNTRMVYPSMDGSKVLVIEEPPSVRTIRVDLEMEATIEKLKKLGKLETYGYTNFLDNPPPYEFTLSFPYLVYIIQLNKKNYLSRASVFFRNSPITSTTDYLCRANLPNISSDEFLCLGSAEVSPHNMSEAVTDVLERFWLNEFNNDYIYNIKAYENVPDVCDFLTWQYFTKIDPMFIYSVKWIPYKRSLGNMIDSIHNSSSNLPFGNVLGLFDAYEPRGTNEEFQETKYTNQCDEIYLPNNYIASVGDEVSIDGKLYYINTFIGIDSKGEPDDVELEDEKGEITIKKLDKSLRKILTESFDDIVKESAEIKGVKVNVGDLIKLKYKDMDGYETSYFKKVIHIRTARDGNQEVKCGVTDFYLLNNIDFEIVSANNVMLNGVQLKLNEVYRLIKPNSRMTDLPCTKIINSRYIGLSSSTHGENIMLEFESANLSKFLVQPDGSGYKLLDEDRPILTSSFIRMYSYLYTNSKSDFQYIKNDGLIIDGSWRWDNLTFDKDLILKKILINNETELHIPSFDIDITFKINDTIVIADWETPIEMLKVRRITSFEVDNDYLYINSVFNGVDRKEPYINLKSSRIRTGHIRKIDASCNGLRNGDKIRANEAGIPHFPKKDTNTIIGFLTDTGSSTPLMLCSNCCTLWAAPVVLNKFDVYKRGTAQNLKLKNTLIDTSKLKYQPGDFLKYGGHGCYIVCSQHAPQIRLSRIVMGYSHTSRYSRKDIDKEFKRYGFITPRYSLKQLTTRGNELSYNAGFPNMHGGFIENSISHIAFKEVREYVQSMD